MSEVLRRVVTAISCVGRTPKNPALFWREDRVRGLHGPAGAFGPQRRGFTRSAASTARRKARTGIRPHRSGGMGLVSLPDYHVGTARRGAVRSVPCGHAAQQRANRQRAGPVALVTHPHQRLAEGGQRTWPRATWSAPNPESSTRSGGAARHGRSHARPGRWSHRVHARNRAPTATPASRGTGTASFED